jgi:hypothetical protein
MEVKVETTRAMRGGMRGLTSTPETGKTIYQPIVVKLFTILSPRLSACQCKIEQEKIDGLWKNPDACLKKMGREGVAPRKSPRSPDNRLN